MFSYKFTLYLLSLSICVTIIDGYVQQKQSCGYCQRQLNFLHHSEGRNAQLYLHQSTYTTTTRQTRLCSSVSTSKNEICDDEQIKQILQRYGFGSRLVSLTNEDLLERPMLAEMYEGKSLKLCIVTGLKPSAQKGNENRKPPLLNVLAMNSDGLLQDEKVIDIGE